jgi:hypothetical protein
VRAELHYEEDVSTKYVYANRNRAYIFSLSPPYFTGYNRTKGEKDGFTKTFYSSREDGTRVCMCGTKETNAQNVRALVKRFNLIAIS